MEINMNHEILKRVIYDQHQVIKNAKIVDRDIELEKNANYVLVGLRRSGKSTLLYKRVQDYIKDGVGWEQIIYINFDDERLIDFTLNDFDDVLLTAEEMSDKEHYFFFDEIQNIDGWEKFAIRLANQKYKVDITGSNAKMVSKEMDKALGGRYISKVVSPYSFNEYLKANNVIDKSYSTKDIGKINKLLEQYFVYGGLPETVNFVNKREYISNVYQKVFYGDIISHNGVRNENGMKLLIKKIAETVGQDVSYTRLQNMITGIGYKISKDIVIDYCGYSKDSFLIFTLDNYYSSFVDKNSTPKYYFSDNGVLSLFIDDKKTSLLENVVANHLYRKYRDDLYFLKGQKADIDFYVASKNISIQCAYSLENGAAYSREIDNLINYSKENKNAKLMIVTYQDDYVIQRDDIKIEVVSLKNFLLNQ